MPKRLSPQKMLARADLVFVGVIQSHDLGRWPLLISGDDTRYSRQWRKLRRSVRVELVLRGKAPGEVMDVVEIAWQGAATGDWNNTRDGMRALFLVRKEGDQYHVVRDWRRSIFPVTTGRHTRLPLGDGAPLWERIALMNYWVEQPDAQAIIEAPYFRYHDPALVLTPWRTIKLLRGLTRHPSSQIRIAACRELISFHGWGQNECWDSLTPQHREQMQMGVQYQRQAEAPEWEKADLETRRVLTASNDSKLRAASCALWQKQHANDTDNGCPADQPPPATMVTAAGDVPLAGPWPQ